MPRKPPAKPPTKPKRRGGPSGKHTMPQRQLRATAELWALVDEAKGGLTWSEWARRALRLAAESR